MSSSKWMEVLGWMAFEGARLRPFIPTYLHLIASSLFPIYVGAHASLSIPSSAKSPPKKDRAGRDDDGLTDEASESEADKIEGLTPKDALLFPLLAGLTLSSLYFVIRWLEDPSILNKVLGYYFMQAGLVFGTKFLRDSFTVARSVFLPSQYSHTGQVWVVNTAKQRYDAANVRSGVVGAHRLSPLPGLLHRFSLPSSVRDGIWRLRRLLYTKCSLNLHVHGLVNHRMPVYFLDLLAVFASLGVVGFFTFLYKPWYVSNLIGFAFCYGSMQFMSPTTFWTGTLLLGALFCYDIYFVFYTPMMVTVATKLDIPIKLLFPRPPSLAESEKDQQSLAMLGLGDIVVPGMMIALALRFDLYLHYLKMSKEVNGKVKKATYSSATGGWGERLWVGRDAAGPDLQARDFPKSYFNAGLIGYTAGMIVTLLMMQLSERPQPALLYLVPGVLGSLWGAAASKGDLNHMWLYNEDKEAKSPREPSRFAKEKAAANGIAEPVDGHLESRLTTNGHADPSPDDESKSTRKDNVMAEILDESSDSNSSQDSRPRSIKSITSPISPSDHSDRKKKLKAGKTSQAEGKYRHHLVWFSIELPPSSLLSPEHGSLELESAEQEPSLSTGSTNTRTHEEESRQLTNQGKLVVDTSVDLGNGEPTGKRRRVK